MSHTPVLSARLQDAFSIEDLLCISPGAGNDFTVQPLSRCTSELLHLHVRIQADANAANRFVHLYYNMLGDNQSMGMTTTAITANAVWHINFIQGIIPYVNGTLKYAFVPLPPFISLDDGDFIHLQNINKQAGDTLTDIHTVWKIWPSA